MATLVHDGRPTAWWKESIREQWHSWIAAWLVWTLDAFDFDHRRVHHVADRIGVPSTADSGEGGPCVDPVVAIGRRYWSDFGSPSLMEIAPALCFREHLHPIRAFA